MADKYYTGDTVQIWLSSATQAGVAADPSGLVLRVRAPAGTVTSYTYGVSPAIIRDATGSYHADIDALVPGGWSFRWETSGSLPCVSEGSFTVYGSSVL